MANTCYLRIHNDTHIDYLVVDTKGVMQLSGSAFHEDQLPEFPPVHQTILIVPGTEVVLVELTMPKTSRGQLEKALPYALEEQLIDDIQQLHFVASKQDPDGLVHVAIVKKALLQTWLDKCKTLNLYPTVGIPDYLALPLLADTWHIYLDTNNAIVRESVWQGLTVEQTQLPDILSLSLLEQPTIVNQTVLIDYDDGNEHFEPETLADVNVSVQMADADRFCMDIFAEGCQQTLPINLLTGEFAMVKPHNRQIFLWRITALVFAACAVIWLLGNIAQYFVYQARVKALEAQVTQLYKQVFPQAQSVVSPQLRIEQQLRNAQNGGGVYLTLLAQVGQQIMAQKAAIKIGAINFRNNTLTLMLSADSFQTLTNLANALQQQGLVVQQQNAASQGNTVSSQMVITGANNG